MEHTGDTSTQEAGMISASFKLGYRGYMHIKNNKTKIDRNLNYVTLLNTWIEFLPLMLIHLKWNSDKRGTFHRCVGGAGREELVAGASLKRYQASPERCWAEAEQWGQSWRLWRKLLEQMETKCQSLEKMTMTWWKEKEKIAKQENKPTGKGSSHNTSSKFQSARLGTENPLRTFGSSSLSVEDFCMLLHIHAQRSY